MSLKKIVLILGMIRFSHTVFALPFALIAAFLAGNDGHGGFCGWDKLLLIVLCMVLARSVAMTFNRIVDARIDAANPRTADRAIPAKKITKKQAWYFLIVCGALFIAACWLFYQPIAGWFGYGNYWPIIFALPVLFFICLYSYTKRFTAASHFWLGASLMLAPIAAWMAVSPPNGPVLSSSAIILAVAVVLWVAGFDIIYACQDIEIDRKQGLYSLPARLTVPTALWISRLCHSLTISFLLLLALSAGLGKIYLAAVIVTAGLLIIEHLLVTAGRIKTAFDLNSLVGILLAGAAITDIMI